MHPKRPAQEYPNLLIALMRLFDIGLVFTCGVAGFYWLKPIKHFPEYSGWMPQNYLLALSAATLLCAWWFPAFNLYGSRRGGSLYGEIGRLFIAMALAMAGLLALIFFTKSADEFSRHWLGLWFGSALAAMTLTRMLLRVGLHYARRRGYNLHRIVLVGDGPLNFEIARRFEAAPETGLTVTGYFGCPSDATGLQHLGGEHDITAWLQNHHTDQVWITWPLRDIEKIESLCRELERTAIDVLLVPDISGLRLLNHSVSQINGMLLINIAVSPIRGGNRLLKWIEDKLLSLAILVLISPLLFAIALAVKLSSPGPVLYRQERVSWNGRSFNMLKFRTLPMDADQADGQPVWGRARSKQPTRVGKFLRKTSLDELPQFINVLKGDMSIVGPRPERTQFVEQFRHEIDRYMQKHLVKAGITGWAQVNGWRGDTCLKKRVEHDLYYIEHWSLWLDMKILWLTLLKGFVNENAY
jgi:putative colanic acid biosynthesis UDP-glucose lipid carrier transferase